MGDMMNRACANCTFYTAFDGGDTQGLCGYRPPPMLRDLFEALHAEPATHINWWLKLNEPHVVDDKDWCSAFEAGAAQP